MRKATLSGRERVQRMFRRQDQDSIPRHESFWSDTIDRWHGEGMTGSVEEYLGSDFQSITWVDVMPYRGTSETISEDDDTRTICDDFHNVLRVWKHRMGTPEHIEFGCKTREDWEQTYKPLYLDGRRQFDMDGAIHNYGIGQRNGRWNYYATIETFEMARRLVGDETFLIALIEDPEWAVDMSRTFTDAALFNLQTLWDAGIRADGVWLYADMAYRSGTLIGPEMYREFVWPDHKRFVDWAQNRGMHIIFHTDGDVNAVVEDYIQAGFDCLQPLEAKAGMDVRNLVPKYKDRLSFFGNNDVMIYATNDRDLIDEEICSKIRAGKEFRGYAYHSDHSVPPSVSWETFQFVIERVDHYGNY
jgi:uroporphyrinogen decarboxylase